ncbi:YdbL family protein [Sphingomicrobium nitratireducens]|uniref:YdbL family protein n=1 Tax=Sphingomicrobium nitratireducens TaxID=2964666 RepID=UPI00223F3D91|nr:DUF1318 domain-containing protein [Sphingomicrobium nitratireducens]
MSFALFLASVVLQSPADTGALVFEAMRSGRVAERYDGYLDFAEPPQPALRKAVGEINIRRRALYVDLAQRRKISPHEVGVATACKLFVRVPEGGLVMMPDGSRAPVTSAGAPLPSYCPTSNED